MKSDVLHTAYTRGRVRQMCCFQKKDFFPKKRDPCTSKETCIYMKRDSVYIYEKRLVPHSTAQHTHEVKKSTTIFVSEKKKPIYIKTDG